MARARPAVCVALLLALAAVAVAGAEPRTIELAIRKGELPQGQRVVRVRQGDDVTLRWTTDMPLAVHLHGYDIEMTLAPGPPTSTRFTWLLARSMSDSAVSAKVRRVVTSSVEIASIAAPIA